jgi:hypothetical protein
MEKPFAPEADHVAADGESGGDLVIGQTFGGQDNDFCPEHLKVWQRILPRSAFEDGSFFGRKVDVIWALSRHNVPSLHGVDYSRREHQGQVKYVAIFRQAGT